MNAFLTVAHELRWLIVAVLFVLGAFAYAEAVTALSKERARRRHLEETAHKLRLDNRHLRFKVRILTVAATARAVQDRRRAHLVALPPLVDEEAHS